MSPWLGEQERSAAARVIDRGWLTEGEEAREFACSLNRLIGSEFGVFAPNGTLALALGLMALGIGPGDEVLVPNITFVGSATAAVMLGAVPVFVDVDRESFQIDLTQAARFLTSRTRAIMPVHLYGASCDMEAIMEFSAQHGLKVIEDAAQGIGVRFRGQHVGSFGDVGCFSFFADKTITTGEGGYVVCRDPAVHERLLYLRNQGRIDRGSFVHPEIGFNFRITDIQAAIGLAQLQRLDEIVERKQNIDALYRNNLAGVDSLRILGGGFASTYVPFRCVILAERCAELAEFLESAGIQTRQFFFPLHRQPCFESGSRDGQHVSSFGDADYPNAMYGHAHGICLPLFPTLQSADVTYVTDTIASFYQR